MGDLDRPTRELITCTVLSVMQTLPQLKAHAAAALQVGVKPIELREAVYQCAPFIGFPKTLNAIGVICFGDIYTRGGLDVKTRELLIYCVLTTQGADAQLLPHALSNLKLGTSRETLVAAVIQCLPYVGFPPALKALNVIKGIDPKVIEASK